MTPVFNEFIDFLKYHGLEYPVEEGYLWLSRMIVRGFDKKTGEEVKLFRIHIDDKYNISYSTYQDDIIKMDDLESWTDTASKHWDSIKTKEDESINVTKKMIEKYSDYKPHVFHSGGKDSETLYQIVKQVIPEPKIIFNNTSNESAETYKYIKKHKNVHIINPEEGFWPYLKRENFIPSRFARSCCNIYKHDSTIDNLDTDVKRLFFMGMRNSESNNRKNYQYEHFFDYYPEHWVTILPIRKWTDMDVWLYLLNKGVEINPIYKMGYSRCGCIVCPYRNSLEELITRYNFPHQIDRFKKIQKTNFITHERWVGLNCTLDEFISLGAWKGGVYRDAPTKEVIEEFAQYKNLPVEVAEKYFNKKCVTCERNIRQKEILSMNLKLNGRHTNKFYCKKHLKNIHNLNNQQWNEMVERFESQGCDLF